MKSRMTELNFETKNQNYLIWDHRFILNDKIFDFCK